MCATRPASWPVGPFWNLIIMLIVKAASFAVSGCPSDHLAPGTVWKVHVFPSGEVSHFVANEGIMFRPASYSTKWGYIYS
jgi:hypothetical protein